MVLLSASPADKDQFAGPPMVMFRFDTKHIICRKVLMTFIPCFRSSALFSSIKLFFPTTICRFKFLCTSLSWAGLQLTRGLSWEPTASWRIKHVWYFVHRLARRNSPQNQMCPPKRGKSGEYRLMGPFVERLPHVCSRLKTGEKERFVTCFVWFSVLLINHRRPKPGEILWQTDV